MSVVVKDNHLDGDIVVGIKKVYNTQPTSLSHLYEILRDAEQASAHKSNIADLLKHYTATASFDVRGLEVKLTEGERTDIIPEAILWKQRAAMLIARWQTSPVTQDIITHILSFIHSEFVQHIKPAIQAGQSRIDVEALISEKVLAPTNALLGENDLQITSIDVLGLLYFLGGNCHIRWDKC
jgi:hypothetical protein